MIRFRERRADVTNAGYTVARLLPESSSRLLWSAPVLLLSAGLLWLLTLPIRRRELPTELRPTKLSRLAQTYSLACVTVWALVYSANNTAETVVWLPVVGFLLIFAWLSGRIARQLRRRSLGFCLTVIAGCSVFVAGWVTLYAVALAPRVRETLEEFTLDEYTLPVAEWTLAHSGLLWPDFLFFRDPSKTGLLSLGGWSDVLPQLSLLEAIATAPLFGAVLLTLWAIGVVPNARGRSIWDWVTRHPLPPDDSESALRPDLQPTGWWWNVAVAVRNGCAVFGLWGVATYCATASIEIQILETRYDRLFGPHVTRERDWAEYQGILSELRSDEATLQRLDSQLDLPKPRF